MFALSASNRFLLYRPATDMRKGFDGLAGLVRNKLNRDPLNGEVFVFINKRRDKIKLLHWEHGGFTLYYKRLEKGSLELPEATSSSINISWSQLMCIMEGIALKSIEKRKRFSLKKPA